MRANFTAETISRSMRQSSMRILIAISIATSVVIAASGCAARAESEQSQPHQNVTRSLDDQVIDVVLNDLLTATDSPLATGKPKAPPATILFSAAPSTYPRTIDNVLLQHDKKQWANLTEPQTIAAQEAAADLVARWKAKEIDPPFAPADARVKLFEGSTTKPTMSRFENRPVLAWRPGFTVDHQFAAVSLGIPWSMHHAEATYLLEKHDGTWRIVLRQFVYFL
jgi:crotonobetainyl-CoA:carnitine CoA-transferase CaiB-like acyl-CoA transferase